MAAFLSNLLIYLGKFIFLAVVAVVGVVCGKKYREHKDAQIKEVK